MDNLIFWFANYYGAVKAIIKGFTKKQNWYNNLYIFKLFFKCEVLDETQQISNIQFDQFNVFLMQKPVKKSTLCLSMNWKKIRLFNSNEKVTISNVIYLYLYTNENVCMSVRVFLGHLESDWDTLWHKCAFRHRNGSKTIKFQKKLFFGELLPFFYISLRFLYKFEERLR